MILLTSVCFKILINPNNASDPQQQGIFRNLLSHLLLSLFCQLSVTYSLIFIVYFHFCFLMFWIDSTFRSCFQHITCSYSRIVVENKAPHLLLPLFWMVKIHWPCCLHNMSNSFLLLRFCICCSYCLDMASFHPVNMIYILSQIFSDHLTEVTPLCYLPYSSHIIIIIF